MKFNKILVLLSAFCVVCTTMPVTSIRNTPAITAYSADEKTYEGLIYHEYEDYITITNYDEKLTGDIVIPSEINGKPVTSIESYAFYNCTKLSNVTCPSQTPPTLGTYVFDNNADGRIIKVPSASIESYKAATNWSQYASALQAM